MPSGSDLSFGTRIKAPALNRSEIDRIEAERDSPNGGLRAILERNGWTEERRRPPGVVAQRAAPPRRRSPECVEPSDDGSGTCGRSTKGGGRDRCARHYAQLRADEREAAGLPRWPRGEKRRTTPQRPTRPTQAEIDRAADLSPTDRDLQRPINMCLHGLVIVEFGDCGDCVTSLDAELKSMEADDPHLAELGRNAESATQRLTLGEFWQSQKEDA